MIVTDSLGCSDTADINLTQSTDTFEVSYISSNVSCFGINDGSASININGGTSGSFLGDTNYIVIFQSDTTVLLNPDTSYTTSTNLSSGTYYFSVTNIAGCIVYDTINILGANQLGLNLITDTICCNGGANGSINSQLSGGIGPFTYNWTGPNGPISGNSPTLTGIGTGNYFLNVTDGNGCITQNSIFVNEYLPISNQQQLIMLVVLVEMMEACQ